MLKPTGATSPEDYIAQIDEPRRSEIQQLHDLIRETVPELEPHIEAGMLGYGTYYYKYASGRELDWMLTGFSPRKANITLYVLSGSEKQESLLKKLGNYTTGKGCLYLKKLKDVDTKVLKELVRESVKTMKES